MKRHFTSTIFILHDAKVLLIHHRKIGCWMPPGGHLEENETPAEAAAREAFEETGLHVALIGDENMSIRYPHAKSFPRPYLCMVEDAAQTTEPPHQHIDFIYLAQPRSGALATSLREASAIRWFSAEEIEGLASHEILPDVREILQGIFERELVAR